MIRKHTLTVLLFLLACFSSSIFAIDKELYQATVPVASYSSADFNKGIAVALSQVLQKASGKNDVATLPAVKKVLEKPDRFIQSYNYTAGAGTQGKLLLSVRFSPKAINNFLRSANQPVISDDGGAGVPVPTETRRDNAPIAHSQAVPSPSTSAAAPVRKTPILVWVAQRNTEGTLEIVPPYMPVSEAMQIAGQKHEISLLWPLMDLEDIEAISPEEVWQLDQVVIEKASRRYQVNGILIGKLQEIADDRWRGDWVWLEGGRTRKVMQTEGHSAVTAAMIVVPALSSGGPRTVVVPGTYPPITEHPSLRTVR